MARTLLRKRGKSSDGRVSFVELFFDLVFVFAIIQLSHSLASHFTPIGFAETMILILAMWWFWIFTTWALNFLDPETMPVRLMLFALMFGGILTSASIPQAWGDRGLMFAAVFVAMQVCRSAFAALAFRPHSGVHSANFWRITAWLAFSGLFWIAGALAGHELRLVLWLVALAIEYVSPAVRFWVPVYGPSDVEAWNVSGSHMAERCALFVIICLGETILISGRTLSDHHTDLQSLAAFATVFAWICLLWWIYFRFGHSRASHVIEHAENGRDAGLLARSVFTYAHIPVVTGIILCAVAAEFVLAHPLDQAEIKYSAAIFGGPAVFLIGNIWVKGAVSRRLPLSHLAGLGLLGVAWLGLGSATLLILGIAAAAILAVVAIWEFVSHGRGAGENTT